MGRVEHQLTGGQTGADPDRVAECVKVRINIKIKSKIEIRIPKFEFHNSKFYVDCRLSILDFRFLIFAKFEIQAPKTIAAFRHLLPYGQKLIHVRWSGEGMWIPLGDQDFGVGFENHTSHPAAGQILLYPGGYSETEILFCYGGVSFASKMGPLAANHFLTIVEGEENLRALGEMVLWKGAQDISFDMASAEQ